MNFQNLNFDYAKQPRPFSYLYTPRHSVSQSEQSHATVRPYRPAGQHLDDESASTGSNTPQPTVVAFAPSTPSSAGSTPELYGPDRFYSHEPFHQTSRPIDFSSRQQSLDERQYLPSQRHHENSQTRTRIPRALRHTTIAPMGAWPLQTEAFRDPVAAEAARVSPGVDDTPYIQYALDALTLRRDDEDNDDTPTNSTFSSRIRHHGLHHEQRNGGLVQPAVPAVIPRLLSAAKIRESQQYRDPRRIQELPGAHDGHASDTTSVSTETAPPIHYPSKTLPPGTWEGFDPKLTMRGADNHIPSLDFRPRILRPASIILLMLFTTLMLTALIVCATYSRARQGITNYRNTIYDGYYFLFRIFPGFLAAVILFYAQCTLTTLKRITPFSRLASYDRDVRRGALFDDLYPTSFLWPQSGGTWHSWVPALIVFLLNFTLPLQSSLFTVILVNGEWRWATVQGVAWTLVALYVLLLVALVIGLQFWLKGKTGLIWDPRSIGDVAALVAHSNSLDDYKGTERLAARSDLEAVLSHRDIDRLGYWSDADHTRFGKYGFWYALGFEPEQLSQDFDTWHENATQGERLTPGSDAWNRISLGSAHDPQVRYQYWPWCLRNAPLFSFVAIALALLIALFAVSFSRNTLITRGFTQGLSAAPVAGAFSSADFLWSFLPSLLGLMLFLSFQSLDMWLRILQPWAELAKHTNTPAGGARAEASILADYAACFPFQVSIHAVKNGHWRLAITSLLATIFVLVPILAGGMFMALTRDVDGVVRIFPNTTAFAVVLALLVVYFLALVSFVPGRKWLRLPHGVTCLAEIISFCANEDLAADEAFRDVRSKTLLRGKLGLGGSRASNQPRWMFGIGVGSGRDGRLGVRRVRRFTTPPMAERGRTREQDGAAIGTVAVRNSWRDDGLDRGRVDRQFVFEGRSDSRPGSRRREITKTGGTRVY